MSELDALHRAEYTVELDPNGYVKGDCRTADIPKPSFSIAQSGKRVADEPNGVVYAQVQAINRQQASIERLSAMVAELVGVVAALLGEELGVPDQQPEQPQVERDWDGNPVG